MTRTCSPSRVPVFHPSAVAGNSAGSTSPVNVDRGANCSASRRRRRTSAGLTRIASAIPLAITAGASDFAAASATVTDRRQPASCGLQPVEQPQLLGNPNPDASISAIASTPAVRVSTAAANMPEFYCSTPTKSRSRTQGCG